MGVSSVEFKHTKAIPHTNLGSSRQVFRNIRGNKRSYKFFVGVDGFLKYQWFNDTVWSSDINIFTAGAVTAIDVKVHDTGTLLDVYIVLLDLTNSNLTYIKGTIGDSADTITFSSSQNIKTSVGVTGFEYNSCGIARTANSELVVTWTEYAGGSSDLRVIGSDGVGATPTWSGETILITGIADGGVFNVLLAVGIEAFSSTFGDRVFVYAGERAGTDGFALEVTDWIQGTGFSSVATDTFAEALWKGVSASIDSNDKVHIAWINDANDVRHALYPTAGGLGTESVVDVIALTAPEFPEAISLSIDHTNDEVWVFYKKHSETADFYYKKSDVVTISFGSERTITIAEDIDYLSTSQRDQDGRMIIVSSPEVTEGLDLNYHQITTVQKQISSNLRVKVLDNQKTIASNLRVKVLDIQKILASNLRVKVLDNQIILASNLRVVAVFQIQIPSNLRIKVLDNQIQIPSNLRVKILDNQIIISSNLKVVILDQEIIIPSNLRVKTLGQQIIISSNLRVKVLDNQILLASNLRVKVFDNQIILASNLRVIVGVTVQIIIPSNLRVKVIDNQIQIPSNLRVKVLDNQIQIPSNLRVIIITQKIIPSNLRVKVLDQQIIIPSNLRIKVIDNQILIPSNLRVLVTQQIQKTSNLRVKVIDNQIVIGSNLRVVVVSQKIIPTNLRVKAIIQKQISSNLRIKVLDQQIQISSNLRVVVITQIQIPSNLRVKILDNQIIKSSNLRVKVLDNQIIISSNLAVVIISQIQIPSNLRVKVLGQQKIIPSNLRVKILDNQIILASNLRVVITSQIIIPSNLRVKVTQQTIIPSNLRVKVLGLQKIISSNLRVKVISQIIISSNLRIKIIDQQIIQPSNLRVKTLDNQIIIPSNLAVVIQSQIIKASNLKVIIAEQRIIPSNLTVKVFGQQKIISSNLRIDVPPLFTITVDDSDVGCVRKLMAQAGREAIVVHQDDILRVFITSGSECHMFTDFQDIMDVQHIRLVDDLDHTGTNFLQGSTIFDKEGRIEIGLVLPAGTDEVMITYATRDGLDDDTIQMNVDMAKFYMTTELWEQEIDFSGSSVYSTMAKWTMCAIATYWSILAMNSSNAIQSGYNYRIAEFEIQTKLWGEGMIAETLLNKYWERSMKMLNALKLYTKDGSIPIYVIDRGNTKVPYHRNPNIFNTITSMEAVTLKDSKSRFAIIMKIVG